MSETRNRHTSGTQCYSPGEGIECLPLTMIPQILLKWANDDLPLLNYPVTTG